MLSKNAWTAVKATIPDGGTLSDVICKAGYTNIAFIVAAGAEGVALNFQACDTQTGTFVDVFDNAGVALVVTIAATTRAIGLDPTVTARLAAFPYIRLKTAVQAGALPITVCLSA